MHSKNLFFYFLIIACFYLEAQSPDDVYLDYLMEEFEEGSKDFDTFSEKHLQALSNGTIDADAAYKVAVHFTNLIVRANYLEEGGEELKEIVERKKHEQKTFHIQSNLNFVLLDKMRDQ